MCNEKILLYLPRGLRKQVVITDMYMRRESDLVVCWGIVQKLSSIEMQNYREKRNTFENCSNSNLVLVLEKATDKVTYLASYSNFTEPLVLEKMNQMYFSKSTSNI